MSSQAFTGLPDALISQLDYDVSGNVIYVGRAAPGSAVGNAVWQIRKLTYDATGNLLSVLWAGGSRAFVNTWTNRASLGYS
jgi:YD repeat-containing protein